MEGGTEKPTRGQVMRAEPTRDEPTQVEVTPVEKGTEKPEELGVDSLPNDAY